MGSTPSGSWSRAEGTGHGRRRSWGVSEVVGVVLHGVRGQEVGNSVLDTRVGTREVRDLLASESAVERGTVGPREPSLLRTCDGPKLRQFF